MLLVVCHGGGIQLTGSGSPERRARGEVGTLACSQRIRTFHPIFGHFPFKVLMHYYQARRDYAR